MVSFKPECYKMLLSENVRRFPGNKRVVQSPRISFQANCSHTHTQTHTHTHILSLSFSHTHTLSHAHTRAHTLSLSRTHTHAQTHTHTLSLSHTYTHTYTHAHTLSLARTHKHAHTLSLTHAHTLSLTHTHTDSLSLSHTHTQQIYIWGNITVYFQYSCITLHCTNKCGNRHSYVYLKLHISGVSVFYHPRGNCSPILHIVNVAELFLATNKG